MPGGTVNVAGSEYPPSPATTFYTPAESVHAGRRRIAGCEPLRTARSARLQQTAPKGSFQYRSAALRALSTHVSITQRALGEEGSGLPAQAARKCRIPRFTVPLMHEP